MWAYLLRRMVERNTWQGIVMLVSGLSGFHLSGHVSTDMLSVGTAIAGVLGIILPERIPNHNCDNSKNCRNQ